MRKSLRALSLLLAITAILSCAVLSASANSAQVSFDGSSATGAVILDRDSPIEVEQELLTFNIKDFPKAYYENAADADKYSSSVTAEYHLYNPSELDVTARLLFPFGAVPYYNMYMYDSETDTYYDYDDTAKYAITLDGEEIEKTVRYTYSRPNADFRLEDHLPRFSDSYLESGLLSRSTPITVYTFEAEGIPESERSAFFEITLDKSDKYALIVTEMNGFVNRYSSYDMGIHARNGEGFRLYVLGETVPELEDTSNWTAYRNGSKDKTLAGRLVLREKGIERTDLGTLAMTSYPEEGGISPVDWYNAVVSCLAESSTHLDVLRAPNEAFDISGSLMRWYDYKIQLGAGERSRNTVTAPIYPDIDGYFNLEIFTYTYLSSPAKSWKSFGSLKVVINTEYFLVENMSPTATVTGAEPVLWQSTEDGYTVTYSALPEEEIRFVLSTSPTPERTQQYYKDHSLPVEFKILIAVSVTALCILAAASAVIIVKVRKKSEHKT